jgi:hypothetical protein
MEDVRPNEQRAKIAILLIWIIIAIETVKLISDYLELQLLSKANSGLTVTMEAANANDIRQQIIAVIYLIVAIVSTVTFIQWFRRAYYNLHTQIYNLDFEEGWAAWSWFVPILNLYRPYKIMKELYHETENLLSQRVENYTPKDSAALLGVWWALWIIDSFLGQFIFRYSLRANEIDELITVSQTSILSPFISIPLSLILIRVIKDYATMETLLYADGIIKEEDDSDIIDSHLT